MRPSSTSWSRPGPDRAGTRRERRAGLADRARLARARPADRVRVARARPAGRAGVARAVLLGGALALGCVSPGRYGEAVDQRDALAAENERLAERVTLLEASNQSLSQERVDLISAVEDLRQEREDLTAAVAELQAARDALEESLRAREEALSVRQEELARLRDTYDGLVSDLQSEVASGRIQIEQLREGLRVKLSQEILFPLGSAELGSEGRRVLSAVASRLRDLPNRIEVQGHTDDLPIHGALARVYPSNWELGGARAASVVRLLERSGLAADRLVAVSFGQTRPVAPNDTPQGRARNRRIEIRLVPAGETASAPTGGSARDAGAPARDAAAAAPDGGDDRPGPTEGGSTADPSGR